MEEHDTGFFFGVSGAAAGSPAADTASVPASGAPGGADSVDAIEVSSEPVTREEAHSLGLRIGETPAPVQQKAGSAILRIDQLPADISSEVAQKLETAWAHLNKNEIAPALTLAQEIVWDYPRLTAPKLIIARCFINRKEYEKALKLLGAIGENEMNAEVRYSIGLSQSRLGRIGEAMESLRLARASSSDAELRKRAGELLQRLQGEPVACPACGKKVLYDSMREVGDETLCADCAKAAEGEHAGQDGYGAGAPGDGGSPEDDESDLPERRRKRLRPPLTPAEILLRALLAPCLLALAWIGLFMLSTAAPRFYAPIRERLPDWTRLPEAQRLPLVPEADQPPAPAAPRLLPAPPFASIPLTRAVAFLELRHSAYVESPDNRDWRYSASFSPEPSGPYGIDPETGEFRWTPAEEDGGHVFTLTLSASRDGYRPGEQASRIAVSAGPRFGRVIDAAPPRPGDARHITAADLDGNGSQEIVLASETEGRGTLAVFTLTGETAPGAAARQRASLTLPSPPGGMGVIRAGDELWAAVAEDEGKARIGYYALRSGNLGEMALEIPLPGRAILSAFDPVSSVAAVMCQAGGGARLIAHRQEGQLRSRKMGEWPVPGNFLWRRLIVLAGAGGGAAPRLVLFGDDAAESAFLFEEGREAALPLRLGSAGTLVDAVRGDGNELFRLVRNDAGLELSRVTLDRAGTPVVEGPARIGGDAAIGGLVVVPGAVDGKTMWYFFSDGALRLALAPPGALPETFHEWPLPRTARPLGETAVIAGRSPADARVAYFDNAGAVWTVSLPAPSVQ